MSETNVFQRGETVGIWAEFRTWAGVLTSPDQWRKIELKDPNGVKKAGYLSVDASTSFTVGSLAEGTTSGATGIIMSKPDGTTLELQQVTGVWQDSEAITDADGGASDTASVLEDATMALSETGKFVYYYTTASDAPLGWWRAKCTAKDGAVDVRYMIANGGFRLEA